MKAHIIHKYNHACECKSCQMARLTTIKTLVRLCDELKAPLNNSSRHDLYLHACEVLNGLADEGKID